MGEFRPLPDTVTGPDNKIVERNEVEIYLFFSRKYIGQCFKSVEMAGWSVPRDAKRWFPHLHLKNSLATLLGQYMTIVPLI